MTDRFLVHYNRQNRTFRVLACGSDAVRRAEFATRARALYGDPEHVDDEFFAVDIDPAGEPEFTTLSQPEQMKSKPRPADRPIPVVTGAGQSGPGEDPSSFPDGEKDAKAKRMGGHDGDSHRGVRRVEMR